MRFSGWKGFVSDKILGEWMWFLNSLFFIVGIIVVGFKGYFGLCGGVFLWDMVCY